MKALYDWILGLAEKAYAQSALFFLSLIEAIFFPIPPDVLLLPLCLGKKEKAWRFAILCTVGSLAGGVVGYVLGSALWWSGGEFSAFANFFFEYIPGFTQEKFGAIQKLYEEYNFWIVFTAGFTPLPFKVITISAGAFDVNLWMFLVASALSRGARFFLIAGLIRYFGEPMKMWIEKYFNLLAVLFVVLLFLGFLVIRHVV
jgi:membrane protein YqaA with SNARE-associated domain